MRLLFFGDVVGNIGVEAVAEALPKLKKELGEVFVIANGENSAPSGKGIGWREYRTLKEAGVDCITLGNHYLGRAELADFIADSDIVRPANVLGYCRGSGSLVFQTENVAIRVTNLLGTAFMKEEVSNPYDSLREIIEEGKETIHIVDYHAESSSEKQIFGRVFDGKVTAVLGTHTHVQTADEKVLPNGTAFITDVGFCGYADSIIGYDPQVTIKKILFGEKTPFRIPTEGPTQINAVLIEADELTGQAISIERIFIEGRIEHGQESL